MKQLSLTNGAAYWGFILLAQSKPSIENLFLAGSLAVKLKSAKSIPASLPNELQGEYQTRVDDWMDKGFAPSPLEVTNEEWEFARSLLRDAAGRKELPGNYHVAALATAFELDKAKA